VLRMTDEERKGMTEFERVAYHEAGHAVVYCQLGVPFKEVSIVASDHSLGHVKGAEFPGLRLMTRSWNEKCIMCVLAGPVMDEMLGQHLERSSSDFEQANMMAMNVTDGEREVRDLIRRLHESTKAMIAEPGNWAAIEALAHVLLEKRTVSARRARRIVRDRITRAPQTN